MGEEILAIIRDYDALHRALRARAEVLKVSRQALDDIAGLQSGYCSKLLGPVPVKVIGRMSLGALLGAMGLKLVLVEDSEALARVQTRIDRSSSPHAGAAMPARQPVGGQGFWRGNSQWGRMVRAKQVLAQSAAKRTKIAKKAARARWAKWKKSKA